MSKTLATVLVAVAPVSITDREHAPPSPLFLFCRPILSGASPRSAYPALPMFYPVSPGAACELGYGQIDWIGLTGRDRRKTSDSVVMGVVGHPAAGDAMSTMLGYIHFELRKVGI